jgi:ABC-type multidrug transport system fused ATPase/permease subunit
MSHMIAGNDMFAAATVSPEAITPNTALESSDRRVNMGFALVLIATPLEWYRVPWLGGRSIIWIVLGLLFVVLAVKPGLSWLRLMRFLSIAPWLNGIYVSYLVCLTCAAVFGPNPADGVAQVAGAWSQYCFFLIVGVLLVDASVRSVARTVVSVVPVAMLVFLGYCQYVYMSQGDSLHRELIRAVSTGNSNAVSGMVLNRIVNHQFGYNAQEGEEITTSVRNTVSASLLGLLFLTLIFSRGVRPEERGLGYYMGFPLTLVGVPLMLFVLMSRSSVLTLLAAPAFCYVIYQLSSRGRRSRSSMSVGLLLGLLLSGGIGLALFVSADNQFIAMNLQRLQDVAEDARFDHYRDIFSLVVERPLLGYGMGAETPDGRLVHNLMLSGWFRAGVAGLILASTFYMLAVWHWLSGAMLAHRFAEFRSLDLNVFWLPALLFAPLLRAPLIGGLGGRLIRGEWLMFACFLAVMAALDQQHAKSVRSESDRA